MRKRINAYFSSNNISRHANTSMIFKTVFMLLLSIIPLLILNTGYVSHVWGMFTAYIVSGLGMAGVGMGIMHDANHGAYSRNRTTNKALGLTMNLIGANATLWKIQHNVLHHTYTNIEGVDEDLSAPFVLRLSPHRKKYWVHRFQHLYVWILYGLSTIGWITTKDFTGLIRYKKMGFIKKGKTYRQEVLFLIGWKLLYYSYTLIIPIIMLPFAPWMVVLAFLTMHFVIGLSITVVFQTAHVMPGSAFPFPDENGLIAGDWAIHQLATTTNYATNSRVFSWLIGGLNFQIEHHLLPDICHVHYRKLSEIVAETAREFGLAYHTKKTFLGALWAHTKMLRHLGTC